MRNGFLFTLCVFAYVSSGEIYATTWYVDQTGEVGVTTIQEAVDLAASGDTISVGPGFFDEIHQLQSPWELDSAVVQVHQEELTIIGAGADQTKIGQVSDWEPSQGYPRGIVGGRDSFGNGRLTLQSVGIEGVYQGVLFQGGGVLSAKDCKFGRNSASLFLYSPAVQTGDSVFVRNCEFGPWESSLSFDHIWAFRQNEINVEDCFFQKRDIGVTNHVIFDGSKILVKNCQFLDGRTGVALSCESAIIENVLFSSQEFYGIKAQSGSVSVNSCQIENTMAALYENDYEGLVRWAVDGLTVLNVSESTLRYRSLGEGYIRNSILSHGAKYVVKYKYSDKNISLTDLPVFEMADNWWGTTDPDSISAYIFDGNDDVAAGVTIGFEPFKLEPLVGVEKSSLSGFKALFK